MTNNWEEKKLVDVCIVERGSSPRPIKDYITDDENGVNWIKIGDTKDVDKYIYKTNQKITKQGAEKSRFVKEGDFILSNSMSFGKPFIMKTEGYIHDGWFVLRLHDFIDTEYFYYLLTSPIVYDQFQSLASGAIVKNISGDLVKKVVLPIPPLAEQQRIVAILDEAFAAIAQAKENAEKNLQNARELFDSYLQSVFANPGDGWEEKTLGEVCSLITDGKHGDCKNEANSGYYFLSAKDVRNDTLNYENARQITKTDFEETHRRTNLKPGDICMVNTGATIGRISIAPDDDKTFRTTFQKSVAVIKPIPNLIDNLFCRYLLKSDLKKLMNVSSGTAVKNLLLGDLKKHKINLPKTLSEQQSIVSKFDALSVETQKLENIYRQKINDLDELKKSILQKAFSGELSAKIQVSNVIDIKTKKPIKATDLQAGIVATAFQRHQQKGKDQTYGRVKAEKIVHLTESILELDLEREPIKDAAGPNDYSHLLKVESRAAKAGFFRTEKNDFGYSYTKGSQFEKLIENTKTALSDKADELTKLIDLFVPLNTQQAELVATVYAAWNNLLIDNLPITDEAIVTEARENWHEAKLKIERERFFKTINWMKENNLIPNGKGKKVSARSAKA